MRMLVVIAIALTGCPDPEPALPPTAPATIDIFEGEGVTWTWGIPKCSATVRTNEGPTWTVVWRDERNVPVLVQDCTISSCVNGLRRGFDAQGRLVISDAVGTTTSRWSYDDRGRIATQREHDRDGDALVIYDYDAGGELVDRTTYAVGGSMFFQHWTRDGAERIVGYVAASDDGHLTSDATWTRDDAGRPVTGRILGYAGTIPTYLSATFDWDDDRYVHTHSTYDTGSWDHDTYYAWNADGALIGTTDSDAMLGVVTLRDIERTPQGMASVRETDGHGTLRWSMGFEHTPGQLVMTFDTPGHDTLADPGTHSTTLVVDSCPTNHPITDAYGEPAWPDPWLPTEAY